MSTNESPDDVTVSGLFSYPVKSCRATAHSHATLLASGLQHDREWMFADTRHTPWRFITQRELPAMATISTEVAADGGLLLSCDGHESLRVMLPSSTATLCKVQVWSSEVFALDVGDAAAKWFQHVTSLPNNYGRLVYFYKESKRLCSALYAKDSGAYTFFADGYPLLLANEASLADLNHRIGRTPSNALPMNRFRPNIVLAGLAAWDEDHIDEIEIGEARIKLVKPCTRCAITTTDQVSGARLSEEPLNTLARFRNNPDLGGVTFAWNAIVLKGGEIALGATAKIDYRFD
jgi:uncharacterized protein